MITFVNIGTGTDARKFILQSVGRGVRIEPVAGKRRRLLSLHNAGEIEDELFGQIRDDVLPLESLFIFGTNRSALKTVIEHLDLQKHALGEEELSLELNEEAIDQHLLLIPVYRFADHPLIEQRDPPKFEILDEELALLRRYIEYLGDDRLLLARHGATPKDIGFLKRGMAEATRYFRHSRDARRFGSIDLLLQRTWQHLGVLGREVEGLKPLQDEVRHFRHIKVFLEDIARMAELRQMIESVKRCKDRSVVKLELKRRYKAGKIDLDQYTRAVEETAASLVKEAEFHCRESTLELRYIANHYYMPVILSQDEKVDYIKHIIRYQSEVSFVRALDEYVGKAKQKFTEFDWWLFSKLDESLDEVCIPYYDPEMNRIWNNRPDFVFWLQKGGDYFIVFVDPKGMQHTGYQHKIDGYKALFRESSGAPKVFRHNGLAARIFLFLYTPDAAEAPEGYRDCWFDAIEDIPSRIVSYCPA